MEKRIELEKRGRSPQEIKELNLDNCRSPTIVGLSDEFCNLESLSLINVGLTSLKGFPNLPNLKKLELSDNRINNGLNLLSTSPLLTSLNLSGNKIKDLESLQPLKDFKHLKNLDLFNNEATSVDNYREKIFKLIPSLKYLDGYDVHECEADEDSDEEVNGNEDESEEGNNIEEEESEEEVGLSAVYDDDLDEQSEGDSYAAEDDDELEEEELGDEEEDEEQESPMKNQARGEKRKLDDTESSERN